MVGLVGIVALAGCAKNPTIITYKQKLNFGAYDADPSATPHNTQGGGFALYHIDSMKVPAQGTAYDFKRNKLYYGQTSMNGAALDYYLGNPSWLAKQQTVTPGTTLADLGCVVVQVGNDALQFIDYLLHDSAADNDSVLMSGTMDPNASIPAVNVAYPETLAQHCKP